MLNFMILLSLIWHVKSQNSAQDISTSDFIGELSLAEFHPDVNGRSVRFVVDGVSHL